MIKKEIFGKKVRLIPATLTDKRQIYEGMAHSDLTYNMMGMPNFPDVPIPTWEEFDEDYSEEYFTDENPLVGRCFLIKVEEVAIGQINYNKINTIEKQVELDIWLFDSSYTKKGFGTDAILAICSFLRKEFDCKSFILAPSKRNSIAVKTYQKLGFKITQKVPKGFEPDYFDTVVMIKELD